MFLTIDYREKLPSKNIEEIDIYSKWEEALWDQLFLENKGMIVMSVSTCMYLHLHFCHPRVWHKKGINKM